MAIPAQRRPDRARGRRRARRRTVPRGLRDRPRAGTRIPQTSPGQTTCCAGSCARWKAISWRRSRPRAARGGSPRRSPACSSPSPRKGCWSARLRWRIWYGTGSLSSTVDRFALLRGQERRRAARGFFGWRRTRDHPRPSVRRNDTPVPCPRSLFLVPAHFGVENSKQLLALVADRIARQLDWKPALGRVG